MYKCEYCGPVLDCMHRREKIIIENSPLCQEFLGKKRHKPNKKNVVPIDKNGDQK